MTCGSLPGSAYTLQVMALPPPVTVLAADFVAEARDVAQVPRGGPPEVAIAGRSNVGKSTLLNRMAGRNRLARVSKTPGRTRGLVLFDLDLRWREAGDERQRLRLVDLPGYGYAQVSQGERRAWQTLVEGYVKRQDALKLVLVLVDARRELGAEELQLMEWLQAMHVPCHLVITKADKLGAAERGLLRERVRKQGSAGATPTSLVSGTTGEGVDSLWTGIAHAVRKQKGDAQAGAR
jgi:GTP-binding protein